MKHTGLAKGLMVGALMMGGVFAAGVNAAMVVYEDVGFIRDVGYESDSFTVPSDGSYRVTLTDFTFPNNFEQLNLSITSYKTEINSVSGSGWFDFEAQSGITYYTNVYGVAGGPLDLGLYGVGVESLSAPVSSVPLPAPLLLLSSALVVLGAFGRGGRNAEPTNSIPGEPLTA